MPVMHMLTVVFAILKLAGVINWAWWVVLMPTLASLSIAFVLFALAGMLFAIDMKLKGKL